MVSTRLDTLIREKGITRYGVCWSVGEGKQLPDGSEDASGCVIDQDGQMWSYWIGWSDTEGRPVFVEWEKVEINPHLVSGAIIDPEYLAARRAAGLT